MNNVRELRTKYMTHEEWRLLENNFKDGNESSTMHDILEYYDDIHTFVTRLCLAEKLSQSCISTAMVFFHKYFILKKCFENDFEKYLTCAACIFLSVKVCNQLTSLEELVKFFLKQYKRQFKIQLSIEAQEIFETSEKLCLIEFDILNCVGFEFNIELPYKYVHIMKFYFFEYLRNPKLIIITTNFINDSFKLPLCLYYDPLHIALASLYLASCYFKVDLVDTKDGVKWFNLIDKNVNLQQIVAIGQKINKIYKFTNEARITTRQLELNQVNKPVIKFEPPLGILNEKEMNLNESNLDVKESDQAVETQQFKADLSLTC